MSILGIRTSYGWNRDKLVVTERKTEHFKKGNDVQTVVQRSYSVHLYGDYGQLKVHSSKGMNVDVKV